MPGTTYYVQECLTCGRNLQVRVEYLGKMVVCQHCGARFEAGKPKPASQRGSNADQSILERADELLKQSGIHLRDAGFDCQPTEVA